MGTSEIADGSVAATDMQDGAALVEILDDDGSGSGLDADFLDGQNSTAFMPAATDNWVDTTGDTMTGTLHLDVDSGGTLSGIYVDADSTGASGYSYGAQIYSDSTNWRAYGVRARANAKTTSYGFYSDTDSKDGTAYGFYSDTDSTDSAAYGFYSYTDSTDGTAYGLYASSYSANKGAYGLKANTTVGTGSTSNAYGIYSFTSQNGSGVSSELYGLYNDARHSGTSGISYGIYSYLYGSDQGDTYGIYSKAIKSNTDTGSLYGLYSNISHSGTSGHVYGVSSIAYSSDSGSTHAGLFSGCSTSGDTGDLYGIYAYSDNDTSGFKYAGYFSKSGGGNYAGFFSGNVYVSGTLSATTKSFIQPHKDDSTKEIVYVSLEGPEHAVFIRGNAALKDGVSVIKMPEHWQQVAAEKGITVNLTPEGAWAPLYVKSKSKSEVVVRVASGGPEDVSFSYCIMAQRDGFQEHEPIQENTHFTAEGMSAWEFENRYTEDTPANMAIRGMLRSNGILNAEGKLNAGTAGTLDWKVTPNEEDRMYLEAHGLAMPEDTEGHSPESRPSHGEPDPVPKPVHETP